MPDKPRQAKGNSPSFPPFFSKSAKKSAAPDRSVLDSATDPDCDSKAPVGASVDHNDVHLIVASQLFDVDWYRAQIEQLAETIESGQNGFELAELVSHYLLVGATKGLDPHPLFDSSFYVEQNADLADTNPLVHFLKYGARARRNPHPMFDSSWYLATYPDVDVAEMNPLFHYVMSGAKEGRRPRADFDPQWYHHTYQRVTELTTKTMSNAEPDFEKDAKSAIELGALEHYVRFGQSNNHSINKDEFRKRLANDPALAQLRSEFEKSAFPVVSSLPVFKRVNLVVDSIPGVEVSNDAAVVDSAESNSAESNSAERDSAESDSTESFIHEFIERCVAITAMLAVSANSTLRIVTRKERCIEGRWAEIMTRHRLQIPRQVEFYFCDFLDEGAELPISPLDIFVVMGWHNAVAVRASIQARKIVYACSDDRVANAPENSDREHADFKTVVLPSVKLLTVPESTGDDLGAVKATIISELRSIADRVFL